MSGSGLASPGVYFREEVAAFARPALRTGVPLFIGFAAEGPGWGLTEIRGWAEFVRNFGDVRPDSYLAFSVRGFFGNGGRLCQVATFPRGGDVMVALGRLLAQAADDPLLDQVDLLCFPDAVLVPERTVELQRMLLDFCRRDSQGRSHYLFAILDALPSAGSDEIVKQRNALVLNNPDSIRSGALYFPWILLADGPSAGRGFVPPCGHIAGIYAARDGAVGVHQAPANVELEGALDLQANVDALLQQTLNPQGINCLRAFPGRGIRVWGARTLSDDPQWTYVNVRRVFLTVCRWIERFMESLVFEPHDEGLWLRVNRELNAYLTDLFRQGAFMGATVQEAFYVRCDAVTNPREVRDLGHLVTEIGLAPTLPGEFIVIRIVQGDSGVTLAVDGDNEFLQPLRAAVQVAEVPILHIEANPPGADVAGEYLLLGNHSGRAVELTNWKVVDRAGHLYLFPRFILLRDAQVRLWTKSGVDTAGDLFWGYERAVWNNTGDTAFLYDAQDYLISTYTYQASK